MSVQLVRASAIALRMAARCGSTSGSGSSAATSARIGISPAPPSTTRADQPGAAEHDARRAGALCLFRDHRAAQFGIARRRVADRQEAGNPVGEADRRRQLGEHVAPGFAIGGDHERSRLFRRGAQSRLGKAGDGAGDRLLQGVDAGIAKAGDDDRIRCRAIQQFSLGDIDDGLGRDRRAGAVGDIGRAEAGGDGGDGDGAAGFVLGQRTKPRGDRLRRVRIDHHQPQRALGGLGIVVHVRVSRCLIMPVASKPRARNLSSRRWRRPCRASAAAGGRAG
ncbi:MAG: hypothetical protein J0H20_19045 [Rhizobiales bacterium]|nr:hypothetical protein [Hyphomicrobiales bacterium]